MARYEWQGATPFRDRRNDRTVEPGTVVEIDAHVADPHPEFVRVEADTDDEGDAQAEDDETSAGTDGEDTPVIDPTAHSVADLRDHLAAHDLDADDLDAIETAERATDEPRTTALEAIDTARE